ncbi:PhzF family phenazine biosynthesis protein [Aminivibrio sp.]|jgi:PhzF family phenazine biosynthesis protein|uniref:PhzF family phenazine biosynthesis protein n=1 Tax=Aminivibrio sp. TaxID=1872489 RepID=UPI001A4BCC2A|nr:PhzF family phenazine biosynthesis protein [Aminivibrio sp.]MBL3539017.1 PhzF family phenazine biosynthesis protein [Aminivibrio sp.]MDK2959396.1 hypothetical protein [Synergistaceae bacterium]
MKYYVVDAFAEKVFEGNPAGVCVMDSWPPDGLMQNIAMENNLSETAFTVKEEESYRLRWFTPGGEIDLCGHATLATAYALSRFKEPDAGKFFFETMSGRLTVTRRGDLFELDFPAYTLAPVPVTGAMEEAVGFLPTEAWAARDLVCVLEDEQQVREAAPDMARVTALDGLLLHLTARGKDYDCVTRSFAPKLNVQEDPVCGSGHCHVIPLWSRKLGKQDLVARQASHRGGTLFCRDCGERILLAGRAVLYSAGEIFPGEQEQ